MSKQTAAASTIEISEARETLMVAMELGEKGWLLGFSSGFGQQIVRRKIESRDGKALLEQISWARERFELGPGPAALLVWAQQCRPGLR